MHLAGLSLVAIALAGCGDNKIGRDDAEIPHDAEENPDAPPLPRAPKLGAQIDRMGRPAISTTLVALRAANGAARTAQRDAYNHASDPATWKTTTVRTGTTIERELAANLAVFDGIDKGVVTAQGALPGCGNPLVHTGTTGPTFYQLAADVFADDQLYVDTAKGSCTVYLALEIEKASAARIIHATCGGRMVTNDVIDVTYSVFAAGLDGLGPAPEFEPALHDGVPVHTDVMETFPFLHLPNP
jgi:hypothetical protein